LVEGRVASSLALAQRAIALPGSAFEIRRTRQSHARTSFREVVKILLTAGKNKNRSVDKLSTVLLSVRFGCAGEAGFDFLLASEHWLVSR
jgi:hypothetical protein